MSTFPVKSSHSFLAQVLTGCERMTEMMQTNTEAMRNVMRRFNIAQGLALPRLMNSDAPVHANCMNLVRQQPVQMPR